MKKLLLMLVLVNGGLSAMNNEGGGGKGFEPNRVIHPFAIAFAVLAAGPVGVVCGTLYAADAACNALGAHYHGVGDSCWGEE